MTNAYVDATLCEPTLASSGSVPPVRRAKERLEKGALDVSFPTPAIPRESELIREASSTQLSRLHNPSYPRRDHYGERNQLEDLLGSCEVQVSAFRKKLNSLGNHPRRSDYERVYHQLLGARDQLADATRRIPLEVGSLYQEDRERLKAAKDAIGWITKRWEAIAS